MYSWFQSHFLKAVQGGRPSLLATDPLFFGAFSYHESELCQYKEHVVRSSSRPRRDLPGGLLHNLKLTRTYWEVTYRLSHIKFHRVIGRRRITIQPPPSGLVKFNMWKSIVLSTPCLRATHRQALLHSWRIVHFIVFNDLTCCKFNNLLNLRLFISGTTGSIREYLYQVKYWNETRFEAAIDFHIFNFTALSVVGVLQYSFLRLVKFNMWKSIFQLGRSPWSRFFQKRR